MIEDYAYEGADLCEDIELPLPEGEEWDDRDEKDNVHHVFNFSILSHFYFVTLRQVKKWFMQTLDMYNQLGCHLLTCELGLEIWWNITPS